MFVKVTYKSNSTLFKCDMEDLDVLEKTFKQLAKIAHNVPLTFIFMDASSGNKSVILNDEDLLIVKATVLSEEKTLVNLEAVECSDEIFTHQQEELNASRVSDNDTEVLLKDNTDEF